MGLLDSVIGGLFGGSNNAAPGMSNILSSILGAGQGDGAQGGGAQGGGGQGGGIGGLISMFEQAGHGDIARSWLGNGANQSVTPDQLQNVFGSKVHDMAQQAGLNPDDFLSQLSKFLPGAVDKMTPDGQVPDQSSQGSYNV